MGARVGLKPGTVVAARYRLERPLGAGGMGEVWAAKNVPVGTDVAVKQLNVLASHDPELVHRFRREAFLLARLRSDHVARVLDFASDEKAGLLLVMDLVPGPQLREVLEARPMTVEEAIEVGLGLLEGLVELHEANVVHRDLKPGNVILEKTRTGRTKAVIVDLGLGKFMSADDGVDHAESGITRADTSMGTIQYMSPEQMLDARSVTGATDIYAVGAILYRAVSGAPPYGKLDLAELAHAKLTGEPPPLVTGRADVVGKRFEALVGKALARKPEQRFASAAAMRRELLELERLVRAAEDHGGTLPMDRSLKAAVAGTLPIHPGDVPSSLAALPPSTPRARPPSPRTELLPEPAEPRATTTQPSPSLRGARALPAPPAVVELSAPAPRRAEASTAPSPADLSGAEHPPAPREASAAAGRGDRRAGGLGLVAAAFVLGAAVAGALAYVVR
jgi:serine/threonine protein kinase